MAEQPAVEQRAVAQPVLDQRVAVMILAKTNQRATTKMTSQRAVRAKWLAAAGIAPIAAMAFAMATSFAIEHQPATAATSATGAVAPAGQADRDGAGRSTSAAEVSQLQAHVRGLRQRLKSAKLRSKSRAASVTGSGSAVSPGSGSYSPPAQAAPAPQTHTMTGASGGRR